MTKTKTFSLVLPQQKLTPYHYWLDNNGKIFPLQFNHDLKTDEDDPSFLSFAQKSNSSLYVHYISQTPEAKKIQFRKLQIHIAIYYDTFVYH